MGQQIKKILKQGFKPYAIHYDGKAKTKIIELRKISKYGERKAYYDGKVLVVEPQSIREKFNRKFKEDYKR